MFTNKAHWVPCFLTMSNLFIGILALLVSFDGRYQYAALLIILAALLDRADGKVARHLNVASDFGKELDSLSDLVSFGVAPAVLVWALSLNQYGKLGYLLAAAFPISGAYRLARFNVTEFVGVFQGIPITMAGGLLSLAVLANYRMEFNTWIYPIIILVLSFLMISKIRFSKM